MKNEQRDLSASHKAKTAAEMIAPVPPVIPHIPALISSAPDESDNKGITQQSMHVAKQRTVF
jgi:hypothetical protein